MPSLRKKPVPPPVEPEPEEKVHGKGRATPTRAEARAPGGSSGRRTVTRAGGKPNDPKAARAAMRDARREKAAEYRKAMNSGDLSKLPARERVPERVMARDYVDQRRNLGPLLLGVLLLSYLLGLAPVAGIRFAAFLLLPICLVAIVADSIFVARRATS